MSEVVVYLQHALHSGNLDYEDLEALERLTDVESGIGFPSRSEIILTCKL